MNRFGELMPTIDELHAADKEHAAAIAALKARVTGHDAMLTDIRAHMVRQDQAISSIQQTLGGLATKADILNLSNQVGQYAQQQLTEAHNSIPAKYAAIFSGVVALLAVMSFALQHFHP